MGALFAYFKVASLDEFKRKLNDDVYPVEVPYSHPPSNHIACAFDFAKGSSEDYTERTLTSPGFFEDIDDPSRIHEFPWPSPRDHMSEAECHKAISAAPPDYAVLGVMWSAHFQDACAAFGMENALMTLMESPEMFQAVIDQILEFYLEANEIFYRAADGRLDAVLIGNDFGSQNSLMVSADQLRRYVFPGTRKLIEQAHSFGLKVIHHSCGAICPIVQDLVDLGADAIHPDDIEFMMAGTLLRLKDAGCEIHLWNLANGCCGSATLSREEAAALRWEEREGVLAFTHERGMQIAGRDWLCRWQTPKIIRNNRVDPGSD